ncbi:MAG TPA: hypothetical protein DCR93_14840, partial [Cytophagales bacterium]|nr:hypothetical protein [Cytophagales bacterium]
KHGPYMEALLVPQVDRVIVTSSKLKQRFGALHPQVHWVPNGARHDLFAHALHEKAPGAPFTFGYLGSIDDRMDLALLEKTFEIYPNHRFLLVGPIRIPDLAVRWERFAHVELIGAQPPEVLPQWVAQFDVALIPFVRNEFTAAIYPMKLNEYLAAGRPVITTRFTDFSDFPVGVRVAQGWLDFTLLMNLFAIGKIPIQAKCYSQWSSQNSWENRGQAFAEALRDR